MELLLNILLISSSFLLIALAMRTGRKLNVTGMPALFAMIVFFLIWVVGNIIESNVTSFQWMLWGRNFQQIGVFITPLCTFYFSMSYTSSKKLKPFAYVITVIQIISVLLIFTDQFHHLMRVSVELQQDAVFGRALVVDSTTLGTVLVAFNFCIPLIALGILFMFVRSVSRSLKRQLWLIIISILSTFVVAVIQSTVLSDLNINIPIPVLNVPSVLLLSYAVLRRGFVEVTPTVISKVFEVIDQGIIVIDCNGSVVEFNKRAAELMRAVNRPELLRIGSPVSSVLYDANKTIEQEEFSPDAFPAELTNPQRTIRLSLAYHKLEHSGRRPIGYVFVLTDITMLREMAEVDALTGVYNRDGIFNAFAFLQRTLDDNPVISGMIIDVDRFKEINDTYGHIGGDCILKDFANIMQELLPVESIYGRLGGDEFVVLLVGDIEDAFSVAEALREKVSGRSVMYLDQPIRYTVSIGVAQLHIGGIILTDLLHEADHALYQAKHQGRNKTSIEQDG